MPANLAAMPEYLIDGHGVTHDDQGHRHWHCLDYDRRKQRYGEGSCEHVVPAI
jgi:hypothetical protein